MLLKSVVPAFFFSIFSIYAFSQKKAPESYLITHDVTVEALPVTNQQKAGTCWSYSTTSFLESEVMRLTGEKVDLSELYSVRIAYALKAQNYVLRQGKAQFGQGGLSHDVMDIVSRYGVVTAEAYSGLQYGTDEHNHGEIEAVMKGFLDGVIAGKGGSLTEAWFPAFNAVLDTYFGSVPTEIDYNGKKVTPIKLAEMLKINPDDYVSFTSFTHHPFYESFILEVPDNWSNGSYYNIRLDELIELIDGALKAGYSLAWDADVSEKTWSRKGGIAVIPESYPKKLSEEELEEVFEKPAAELEVDEEIRQREFENYNTTDDHLMHIVGIARDQEGTKYYRVKNSWGENAGIEGYQYVSESYMRLKTISVTIHKDAVPRDLKKKSGI